MNESSIKYLKAEESTIVAKSVAMSSLFAASMALGSLPLLLKRLFKWHSNPNNIFVQVLLCIGGGVLLCTTFLHLLPEVSDKLRYLSNDDIHYAELLMCIGFFTMYLVEECVHCYIHRRRDAPKPQPSETTEIVRCYQSHDDEENHNHHSHLGAPQEAFSAVRGLLVILALSIHELFEGLAVGLETVNQNVWYMFGAVSAHKLVIAFCIGVELVASKLGSALVLAYVFCFAIVSPIGIGIGLFLSESGQKSSDWPPILLQGLASGTLLYVVFFEILTAERKKGLTQFFAVFTGFMIMLGLTYLE